MPNKDFNDSAFSKVPNGPLDASWVRSINGTMVTIWGSYPVRQIFLGSPRGNSFIFSFKLLMTAKGWDVTGHTTTTYYLRSPIYENSPSGCGT